MLLSTLQSSGCPRGQDLCDPNVNGAKPGNPTNQGSKVASIGKFTKTMSTTPKGFLATSHQPLRGPVSAFPSIYTRYTTWGWDTDSGL